MTPNDEKSSSTRGVEAERGSRDLAALESSIFAGRALIIAANRGPVTFQTRTDGSRTFNRGSGGLVTALMGLAQHVNATWVACARSEEDAQWEQGDVPLWGDENTIRVNFLSPSPAAYDGYYNVIANPLLWFLQHSMWDVPRQPVINLETWQAWEEGYVAINRQFADAIVDEVRTTWTESGKPTIVMLHDYHLYLAPRMVRTQMRPQERPVITHFVHIPWPGPDYWQILPPKMRVAILEGLLGCDVLGFQTKDDALNFMRTCQRHLHRVGVKYGKGRVWYRNHATYIRAYPISIDVGALRRLAGSDEVAAHRADIEELVGDRRMILRVERVEPSKNIVRGFIAYEEFLELYPDYIGEIQFVAILVPSRMDLGEYQDYLDEVMSIVGRINARYATADWEPIRVLVGESYVRAVAAMQRYDVLLVNSVVDGMNLVAKEGPIVNERCGALILSERTGAREQLQSGAIVIAPCDIHATALAIHEALNMPDAERCRRAAGLVDIVEENDITFWLTSQLETIAQLEL
jgi:trehalose 6-phosphate synthase